MLSQVYLLYSLSFYILSVIFIPFLSPFHFLFKSFPSFSCFLRYIYSILSPPTFFLSFSFLFFPHSIFFFFPFHPFHAFSGIFTLFSLLLHSFCHFHSFSFPIPFSFSSLS